jgi:flagellar motor switch protein FliN/FliY
MGLGDETRRDEIDPAELEALSAEIDAALEALGGVASAPAESSGEQRPSAGSQPQARPVQFAPLKEEPPASPAPVSIDLLMDVTLKVSVELGRATVTVREALNLAPGSVLELDKLAGDPVDILVNDHLIARGEVVVVDDQFGVRITEIVSPRQRVEAMR